MRPYLIAALLLVSTWAPQGFVSVYGESKGATSDPSQVCPVTGKPIDRSVSIDYEGARLYFCCPKCIATYQADPARYAVNANYQLAATGQAKQVACPFTGKPLNANIPSIKVGVIDVGFCCTACRQTVADADPEARFRLVFGDAFAKGFAVGKK
jgi:YHS domain-containing protein